MICSASLEKGKSEGKSKTPRHSTKVEFILQEGTSIQKVRGKKRRLEKNGTWLSSLKEERKKKS